MVLRMKKIAVVMQHFKIHGGIESCTYSLIEGLNNIGIKPDVYGRVNYLGEEKTMREEIVNRFGRILDFDFKLIFCDKINTPLLNRYKQDATLYIALTFLAKKRYDFIYDFTLGLPYFTNNGRYFKYWNLMEPVDIFSIPRRFDSKILEFLYHFPKRVLLDVQKKKFYNNEYIIALNSKYTAELAKRFLNKEIQVIYPPVNLKLFWSSKTSDREGVITWGRFAEYKQQLEQVEVAKLLKEMGYEVKFRICGGTECFPEYYQKVKEYVIRNKISNVELYPNISILEFKRLLESSLFYMHNMRGEPFGITTAEAIAGGCIPIVHDSGGQREIVPFEELRFSDKQDAIKRIIELSDHGSKLDIYRKKLQEHVKQFDEKIYKTKLLSYVQ
jgi:glycosyltransferase involved in cell wall biosynthesis